MIPIKTGIIGFGRMAANHHLSAMRETGLFEITDVCDITESRRQAGPPSVSACPTTIRSGASPRRTAAAPCSILDRTGSSS